MGKELTLQLPDVDDLFGTDKTLEAEGAWVELPAKPGVRVKIRSQGDPRVQDIAAKINRRHMPLFRIGKPVPAAEARQDTIDLAAVMVLEWEGFNNIPCTLPNVLQVLTQYPHFAEWIDTQSKQIENFKAKQTEEVLGNFVASSELGLTTKDAPK